MSHCRRAHHTGEEGASTNQKKEDNVAARTANVASIQAQDTVLSVALPVETASSVALPVDDTASSETLPVETAPSVAFT